MLKLISTPFINFIFFKKNKKQNKKNVINNFFFLNFKKILKLKLMFFLNVFFYDYILLYISAKNMFKRTHSIKKWLNREVNLISLVQKHPKIHLLNFKLKYFMKIYTLGILRQVLKNFEKNKRRSLLTLKFLLVYLINKKIWGFNKFQFIFIFKNFKKKILKIFYLFNFIIKKFHITLFYINPLKSFKITKIKKKKSIKRRVYKKLITFNNKNMIF